MQLLIVRHAVAFERDPRRWPDDDVRPLTSAGAVRARTAAQAAKRFLDRPTLVLTSPLVRARDTAHLFTRIAAWPEASECAALRPGGDAEAILQAVRADCSRDGVAALFGHQPDLGVLLATCLCGRARGETFELKKSAIACVAFDGPPRAHTGTLTSLLAPKLLRALSR